MHKILVDTHKESNINILKARDYFFDKARVYNNYLRKICLLIPISLSILGMFFKAIFENAGLDIPAMWLEQYLEIIVGCVTIVLFVVDFVLQNIIDDYLSKSNALRELYDVKVLDLKPNEFYYNYSESELESFIQKSQYVKDSSKYEVWYREIFSEDSYANAICAMMDNMIYTYYVYTKNKVYHLCWLILVSVIFVLYCILYFMGMKDIAIVNPFILFLAGFDFVKETIESYYTSKELAQRNEDLKRRVLEKQDKLKDSKQDRELMLRTLEDVIIDNREKGLFIPKWIREKYLKNDSEYYKELDKVKHIFWGNDVIMPEKARDYQICSIEDENVLVDLETIHQQLKGILKDIKMCLDKNNLEFMLDGGTLIGACRESNHNSFLQWDDDIDIAVKSSDVPRIKKLLESELGQKYDIQDYENEDAYSPRLSTFRVRLKNDVCRVSEKDSELYEKYKSQGLFIDVYAYCPILVCRWIDKLFRFIFIHPLNRRIAKVESKWKYVEKSEEYRDRYYMQFKRLKKKYMSRAKWYIDHANNKTYVSYEPFYIYDLKEAGPYIKTSDIYGQKSEVLFEGDVYGAPTNCDAVLRAFYGKEWDKSPYISLEELNDGKSINYSKAEFDSSCYKHLKRVSIYQQ